MLRSCTSSAGLPRFPRANSRETREPAETGKQVGGVLRRLPQRIWSDKRTSAKLGGAGAPSRRSVGVLQRVKRAFWRLVRAVLSWASLLAIPIGLVLGLKGYRTLGALLILGGTIAYFLVDPILMLLDLMPSGESRKRSQRR
jgi:hypothetical protein